MPTKAPYYGYPYSKRPWSVVVVWRDGSGITINTYDNRGEALFAVRSRRDADHRAHVVRTKKLLAWCRFKDQQPPRTKTPRTKTPEKKMLRVRLR